MTDADLAFAPIPVLAARLRNGAISSVELTKFFLDRLEKHGPNYNCLVTLTRDLALDQAAKADADLKAGKDRGPLHGIPFGAKDLLATRGIPTSWGAPPFKTRVIDRDATVIRKLREAGAVLAAKLSMVELAGGMGYRQANASLTGPGLNPWDVERWSGGSSSGSGSAVAAGLVAFAIGSETIGSINSPSSQCGITGLRPTYGRASRAGAMALSWTLDKIGPMARTAQDCGTILAAIAGPDPDDPSASDRPFRWTAPSSPGRKYQTRRPQGRGQVGPARGQVPVRPGPRRLPGDRHDRRDRTAGLAERTRGDDNPRRREGVGLRGDGRCGDRLRADRPRGPDGRIRLADDPGDRVSPGPAHPGPDLQGIRRLARPLTMPSSPPAGAARRARSAGGWASRSTRNRSCSKATSAGHPPSPCRWASTTKGCRPRSRSTPAPMMRRPSSRSARPSRRPPPGTNRTPR